MSKNRQEARIIFESDRALVIAKPFGWHSVNQRIIRENSVETWLKKNRPTQRHLKEAGLVQRLDYETTGCILAAKSEAARLSFTESKQLIKKRYWALAMDCPRSSSFDLYFYSRYRSSKKVSIRLKGKPSERGQCSWKLLKKINIDALEVFLLEVELKGSGKRHQIRAGLSFLDCPLLGDTLYGGTYWNSHLALHAREIEVEGTAVRCEPPEYWKMS